MHGLAPSSHVPVLSQPGHRSGCFAVYPEIRALRSWSLDAPSIAGCESLNTELSYATISGAAERTMLEASLTT